MADTIDRVFGHALNTVNKIRPGSQKPPAEARLALYGLYKQAMEGNVAAIADRPTSISHSAKSAPEVLRREQDKYDAWKSNEGLSRTEAKRRYVEKLIETMHRYANGTDQAKELVEELEFVWDQVKSNSQHSSSEHSSPPRIPNGSGYMTYSSSGHETIGIGSSAAGLESIRPRGVERSDSGLRVLSPVSQPDQSLLQDGEDEMDGEEFVDAPVSQVDMEDLGAVSEQGEHERQQDSYAVIPRLRSAAPSSDSRWRKRVESSLIKLTVEVTALREQLESRRFFANRRHRGLVRWTVRIGWWCLQLTMANAVLLWIIVLYMRRRKDDRLEGAIRVLLGDAAAQVKKVGRDVKIPTISRITTPRRS